MRLYTLAALAAALPVPERVVYSSLRGPGGDYLGGRNRLPRSLAELVAVASVVVLGPVLRPSQRAAALNLPLNDLYKLWAMDPWSGLRLVIPAGGLDPRVVDVPRARPQDVSRMWSGLTVDLFELHEGLRKELDRLADENASWAARNVATFDAAWFKDDSAPKAKTTKRKRSELPAVLTLRDVVEE